MAALAARSPFSPERSNTRGRANTSEILDAALPFRLDRAFLSSTRRTTGETKRIFDEERKQESETSLSPP